MLLIVSPSLTRFMIQGGLQRVWAKTSTYVRLRHRSESLLPNFILLLPFFQEQTTRSVHWLVHQELTQEISPAKISYFSICQRTRKIITFFHTFSPYSYHFVWFFWISFLLDIFGVFDWLSIIFVNVIFLTILGLIMILSYDSCDIRRSLFVPFSLRIFDYTFLRRWFIVHSFGHINKRQPPCLSEKIQTSQPCKLLRSQS